jgi:hypothetical protein
VLRDDTNVGNGTLAPKPAAERDRGKHCFELPVTVPYLTVP